MSTGRAAAAAAAVHRWGPAGVTGWLSAAPPAGQWLPSSWQGAEGAAAAHFLAPWPHLSAEGLGGCCALVGLAGEAAERVDHEAEAPFDSPSQCSSQTGVHA